MRTATLVTCLLALTRCGGAVSLVLKGPISDRCKDVGLRGCDDLSEGVILYVSGDRDEGSRDLRKGIAANEPDQLREFGAKLRMLKSIPGASDYSQQLDEIADLLGAGAAAGGGSHGTTGVPFTVTPSDTAGTALGGAVAAGRASSVVPITEPSQHKCGLFADKSFDPEPGVGACVDVGHGPMLLTDVQTTGACRNALIIGAGSSAAPTWFLLAAPGSVLSVHGASMPVKLGETLYVAQVVAAGADAERDARCAVTWAAQSVRE